MNKIITAKAKIIHTRNGFCIKGWATVFNKPDHVNDVIKPDAFGDLDKRIQNGQSDEITKLPKIIIPMCYEHDLRDSIIGIWIKSKTTSYGLYVEGLIYPENIDIINMIKSKRLAHLSIAFSIQEQEYVNVKGTKFRLIKKATLAEISLVKMGCQSQALFVADNLKNELHKDPESNKSETNSDATLVWYFKKKLTKQ